MKKFRKILKNILLGILTLILIAGALTAAINTKVITAALPSIISSDEAGGMNADCILVLGAGASNGKASPMLADRLDEAVDLYDAGAAEKILVSGDGGSVYYNETEVMKEYAAAEGVPEENINCDSAGFSTYESIYRLKNVFQAQKVIIVTQRYHLYRALYIARQLGLDAYGVASEGDSYRGQYFRDVREALARVKDYFQCVLAVGNIG